MGRFSGVSKARQTGGGNWWTKGRYRGKVNKVEFRDGHRGQSYIVECEVLESNSDEVKVGETRSQVIKMDKESALGNIASFLCVCASIMTNENLDNPDQNEIDEATVEASYGPEQPLVGLELVVEAIDIVTKAGKPFTKIVYHVPEDVKVKAA